MLNTPGLFSRSACLFCLFAMTACSSISVTERGLINSGRTEPGVAGNSLDRIAADFVHALVQIPGYEPLNTTVQFERDKMTDGFVEAMRNQLQNSGYGIRWVNTKADDNLFQYRRETESDNNSLLRQRFELALGDVEFRRTYVGVDDMLALQPVTPLYIRGADASRVILNDAAFAGPSVESPEAKKSLSLRDEVSPLSTWARQEQAVQPLEMPLLALPTIMNVFELGGSNHADALQDHKTVVERILTFPNDSLRLGTSNKQIVHSVVSTYNASTDVFSVLGCSLGPTALKGGNAALALGRASRVKEALLFAGVEPDKILDEGCWAGDSEGNTLPKRGVILTLNRRI